MRSVTVMAVLLAAVLTARAAGAQAPPAAAPSVSPPVEFDVISVKPHTSDDQGRSMVAQPGGRFLAINIPLRMVIRTAYQVQDDQIIGAPDWIASERFDIDARANAPGPPGAHLLDRLQAMLAERFGLAVHHDTKELPIYALVRANRDGALGPGLRPTACPELSEDLSRRQPCTGVSNGSGRVRARGMPFDQLLPFIAPQVNRVIVNRTALDGRYDLDLTWTPDPRGIPVGPGAAPRDPNAVSIFTAVQEQLGLKLEATRGPVPVLVVDHVERPMPN